MKIISILIIFVLIKLNLSINYDLTNNIEKSISSLKSDLTYNFYIEAKCSQVASINLVMNYMKNKPFNYVNIYEYSSRSTRIALKTTSKQITISSQDNQLLSHFGYLVNNSATEYISLSLEPTYNISSLTVKIGVQESIYDLSEGVSKNLTDLQSNIPYYFYLPSTLYKTNCIRMEMNKYQPFTYYNILEFSERSSLIQLKNTEVSVSLLSNYKISYNYLVSKEDTKYIALKIIPNKNIGTFSIIIDIKGGIYDLSTGIPKNITYLTSGIQYFFSIPSTQFQTNCINLTMNYMELKPIKSFIIYEMKNRISYITKTTIQYPSFSSINNQLISSFAYFVNNSTTEFIYFKIIPNNDINYFVIQTNVEGGGYELTKGFPKNITNLKFGIPYYFYIPSIRFQTDNITLAMNYIDTKPFSRINIYEYEEISYLKYTKNISQIFTTSNNDNQLILLSNYLINSSSTKYLGLEIIPNYNISYLVAQIDVEGNIYYLSNGNPKNITNLKAGIPYYFNIESTKFQTDCINLITNFMDRIPLTNLYIYELLSQSSSNYINNISQTITTSNINNQLIGFSNYLVNNYNTKYIVVKIIPNYNIDNLIIQIDVEGGTYDLSNGVPKKFTNLKSGIIYYFFIPSSELQTNCINITMNLTDNLPFTFLHIFECRSREPLNHLKNISQTFTALTKNNQFLSSFKYLISNYSTKYFALKIIPTYNIIDFAIKINVEGGAYNLSNGTQKNISNLQAGIPYYFFIPSTQSQRDFINLVMNYMNTEPFTYINIYEYTDRSSLEYTRNISQAITTSFINDQLKAISEYSVNNYNTKYVALEIIPKINIDYIIPTINVEKNKYNISCEGNEIHMSNLKSYNKYYVYLYLNGEQKIDVYLNMGSIYYIPFSSLYIYELNSYSNNIESYTKKEYKYLENENNQYQSIKSFYYKSSSNTNYAVLEIEPELDLGSLKVKYQKHSFSPNIIILIVVLSIILSIIVFCTIYQIRKKVLSKRTYSYEASKAQPLYPLK